MLCYESNIDSKEPPKVLELKRLLGYEYIIADFEVCDYLLQTHQDFKNEIDERILTKMGDSLGNG